MTAATGVFVGFALVVGLLAGFALARIRPTPPALDADLSDGDDETRPTLVPFRVTREGGRPMARTDPDAEESAEDRAQLDALLADLERRPKR